MIESLRNIFAIPDLRKRVLFTFLLLGVYRLGSFIPIPGVDPIALQEFFEAAKGTILSFLGLFTGGALERMTVFALGIMPYISASIILQLLTVVWPYLEKLSKEGELGRKKITQYTRYGTVVLSIIQSLGISFFLERTTAPGGAPLVPGTGWGFRFMTVLTLTTGTAFVMWLGEQITERGVGNGISLIIFAGIVAGLPRAIFNTLEDIRTGSMSLFVAFLFIIFAVVVVGAIVLMERAQRRIPVQYAKRVVGRRTFGGQSTHLPLKVNTSGVIPPIFASSVLLFPATLASWFPFLQRISDELSPGGWVYNTIYVVFIVFFAYFYTAVTFNPVDVADNLKKYGGYIPGIRPGKKTAEYIDYVLSRITFGGALYLAAVCVLPTVLINQFGVPFYFGGTALLIVVGVALDTVQQIEGHLITRHYEGFTGPRGPRIRGRATASGMNA